MSSSSLRSKQWAFRRSLMKSSTKSGKCRIESRRQNRLWRLRSKSARKESIK
jgi:hypothetical protein